MKKVLVAAILGLAAVTSVKAQGSIVLYNYATGKQVLYGIGSGGTVGQPVSTPGFNVGFYWVNGASAAAINSGLAGDTAANGDLSILAPTLSVFAGANGTTTTDSGFPGYFSANSSSANLGVAGGSTVTIVLVAYNGANYASSNIRGHSAAFQMTAQALPATAADVGTGAWTSFQVSLVPEPSTFALAGLGLAGLLIFRRRN